MKDAQISKTIKVGSSVAVVIPKHIRDALYISRGDYVVFAAYDESSFFVRVLTPKDIQELKPKNIQHNEINL